MNVIINYPKDKTTLEDNIAYIKAMLMQKYIDNSKFEENIKISIKKGLIEKIEMN